MTESITLQVRTNLKTYFGGLKFTKLSPISLLTTFRITIDNDRLTETELILYSRENVRPEALIYKNSIRKCAAF